MQTCGADRHGMRVEWRDSGGRTRLVGVTGLGWMLGNGPNLALSMLEGLGRWEAGRSAGGMDPQRKGWGRLQARAEETTTSSSSRTTTTTTSGGGAAPPPPRPPRKNPATSRVATKRPPPKAQQTKPNRASPRPRPSPRARARAKPPPPPPNPKPPPCKIGAGTPMGMCRVWRTPGMSLGRRGAMGGPSAK